MDRFGAMSVFLAVVDAGGISAASRKLRMPVATVSRRISDLERCLKARLFTRTSRQIMLTDAGHSFAVACRRIVRDLGEAEREAAGEHRALKGQLLLSAPIASALLGAIVIGSISNGMDLLALDSDIKFMITGAVLLLAVTIDAVTRRAREASR